MSLTVVFTFPLCIGCRLRSQQRTTVDVQQTFCNNARGTHRDDGPGNMKLLPAAVLILAHQLYVEAAKL
jgi:hypothetical protein